jgi:hypothetical protein
MFAWILALKQVDLCLIIWAVNTITFRFNFRSDMKTEDYSYVEVKF